MASIDYYNAPEQWGQYQYVTLKDTINNYMAFREDDDFTSSSNRTKILYHARRGFRELYHDVVREVKAISLELSPTLNVILPPDFVNYVRISWVDEHGQLNPMAMDDRMSIAREYLQDSNYNLLFDSNGCVLEGNSPRTPMDDIVEPSSDRDTPVYHYQFCNGGFRPNEDQSRVFNNGRYKLDTANGIIQFGSDAAGREIVLEYISDGLFTGCEGRNEADLRIHKFAESALLDYIYYETIKTRRSVPANEKARARREYFNSRKIAKQRMNSLRVSELLQVFKKSLKWIK